MKVTVSRPSLRSFAPMMAGAATSQRTAAIPAKAPGVDNFCSENFWRAGPAIQARVHWGIPAEFRIQAKDSTSANRSTGCYPRVAVQLVRRIVTRFREGLVLKAQRPLYHSTLGSRAIKKKKKKHWGIPAEFRIQAKDSTRANRSTVHDPRVALHALHIPFCFLLHRSLQIPFCFTNLYK